MTSSAQDNLGAQRDVGGLRLRFRSDLQSSLHEVSGISFYLVEDPVQSRFYRMGQREWSFARQLDGQQTIRDALRRYAESNNDNGLSPTELLTLCKWLMTTQLVNVDEASHVAAGGGSRPARAGPWWLNPFFVRIPLFNPDACLKLLLPWFAWTLTLPAVVVWCIVCLSALYQLLIDRDRLTSSLSGVLAANNWLLLITAWIALKVVHELYHGLICKKYGGTVPRCGIAFILFSPLAFVDVTSSWRFRSKWQRIFTAGGGMYVELFIAGIAAWVWTQTDPGILQQQCRNIMLAASISTLLFNGNFLMKFDGYYMLADLLEIQNLYAAGQQYLRYLVRRYLLAVPARLPQASGGRLMLIRVYAVSAFLWRLLFYAGILIVAANLFHGAGVVLAVLAAAGWFVPPWLRFLHYICWGTPQEQPNRWRLALSTGLLAAAVHAVLQLNWPGGVTAPAVVDYAPLAIVRVDSPGFVRQVHVRPGQRVQPGQRLATLENPSTVQELQDIKLAIQQSQVMLRILHRNGEMAAYQVEQKNVETLQQQRDELSEKVANLSLRSATTGRVIGRHLDSLLGQYLDTGQEVMSVGDESAKELQVSVAQQDVDFFVRQRDESPFVRVEGRTAPIHTAVLTKVAPKASCNIPHAALTAAQGGPLPVMPRADDEDEASPISARLQLVQPRFLATVALPVTVAQQLRAGQLARVRLQATGPDIGQHLAGIARRWWRAKIDRSS